MFPIIASQLICYALVINMADVLRIIDLLVEFFYNEHDDNLDWQKNVSNLSRVDILLLICFSFLYLDIYFHRDVLCYSNDGLNIDLLTVTSNQNMTDLHEKPLLNLFPDPSRKRARIFKNKKVTLTPQAFFSHEKNERKSRSVSRIISNI